LFPFNQDLFGLGNLSSLPKSNGPFENGEEFFRAKIYFTIDKANNAIYFKHVSFGVDFVDVRRQVHLDKC